jgi:probable HAF family extracellular repeat protein
MSALGTLPGGTYSSRQGINQSGQVTGYSDSGTSGGNNRAFLFSNGTMSDLNSLIPPNSGWTLSEAFGINDTGQITGTGAINGATHAFLLNPVVPTMHTSSNQSILTDRASSMPQEALSRSSSLSV